MGPLVQTGTVGVGCIASCITKYKEGMIAEEKNKITFGRKQDRTKNERELTLEAIRKERL